MLRQLQSATAAVALAALSTLPACGQKSAASEPGSADITTTTNAATSGESVGVPECDSFLTKYQACLNGKVPESVRAQFSQSIDQMRGAWRAAAATAEGKSSLASACTQARDTSKAAMSAYGCTDF